MNEKKKKIIKISALVLTLMMITLFSLGTILMMFSKKDNEPIAKKVQYRTAGIYAQLKKFELDKTTVAEGEDIRVDVKADGISREIDYYAIWAKNKQTGEIIYQTIKGERDSNLSKYLHTTQMKPGEYEITGLTVALGRFNNDNSIAYNTDYYYIPAKNCENAADCENAQFIQKSFTVIEKQEDDIPVYEYTIAMPNNNPTATIGDKLDIVLRRVDKIDEVALNRRELKTMMLSYINTQDGTVLNMYVKSLNNNPYIIIPSTATVGTYNLDYGYLTFEDNTSERFKNTEKKIFSYNLSFSVKEKDFDKTKYSFNNELYDESIENDLNNLNNDAIITIDANKMPLINEKIFKSIKNTKRTLFIEYESSKWVFSGADIKTPKTIDVSTLVSKLENDNEYYNKFLKTNVTSPSALLKFSDNGDLPGKVLIKIESEKINKYLKNPEKAYVYYYQEDKDKLVKVAMEIQENDGFYEFYINHNSKYIIASKEIKSNVVSSNTEMLSLNNQISSNNSLLLTYIIATICGIIAMFLLISLIIEKQKNKKLSQQVQ